MAQNTSVSLTTVVALCLVSIFTGAVLAGSGTRNNRFTEKGGQPTIAPTYPPVGVFAVALRRTTPLASTIGNPVIGVVVNHHLLAADFISDTLQRARRPGIDRIILLAPNHFAVGHGRVTTTREDFQTPFGLVPVDQPAVAELQSMGVTNDPTPFSGEHGVFNLLPFIRRLYPDVPIVPIITKDGTPDAQIDDLGAQISRLVTPRTLIIASLDFAHEQTNAGAERLDTESIRLLTTIDPQQVQQNPSGRTAVDSPGTLRLFFHLLRAHRATVFTLLHHSNSAQETGKLLATDVTSHIAGLFSRFPIVVY